MLYFNTQIDRPKSLIWGFKIRLSAKAQKYRCTQRPKFDAFRQNGHFSRFAHLNPRICRFLKNSTRKQQAIFRREKVANFRLFFGRFSVQKVTKRRSPFLTSSPRSEATASSDWSFPCDFWAKKEVTAEEVRSSGRGGGPVRTWARNEAKRRRGDPSPLNPHPSNEAKPRVNRRGGPLSACRLRSLLRLLGGSTRGGIPLVPRPVSRLLPPPSMPCPSRPEPPRPCPF